MLTQLLSAIWLTTIPPPHSTQLTVCIYMTHLYCGYVVQFFMHNTQLILNNTVCTDMFVCILLQIVTILCSDRYIVI
jgi:hypothetical protein